MTDTFFPTPKQRADLIVNGWKAPSQFPPRSRAYRVRVILWSDGTVEQVALDCLPIDGPRGRVLGSAMLIDGVFDEASQR